MQKIDRELDDFPSGTIKPAGLGRFRGMSNPSPLSVLGRLARVDWSEHASSRQATKADLIDIAHSLGVTLYKGASVIEIRAQIRAQIGELIKAVESLPRESYAEFLKKSGG